MVNTCRCIRLIDEFKARLDECIERFKSVETIHPDQKIIIFGEIELDCKVNGIPLVDAVVKELGVEKLSEI